MKASEAQQTGLLDLATLDLEISRTKATLANLTSGAAFTDIRAQQRDAAAALIERRNALDSVELDISRADADLKLVEQRIEKDKLRLNQTSSSKDAQGIQSELETLAKRKSELEDLELAVLERKEEAEASFKIVMAEKQVIDGDLAAKEAANEAEIMKLRSGLDLVSAQRQQQASRIDSELMEIYAKKAARGIPVGRLINRECGACRMTIGATALTDILAMPRDELVTCPDCQAILIR